LFCGFLSGKRSIDRRGLAFHVNSKFFVLSWQHICQKGNVDNDEILLIKKLKLMYYIRKMADRWYIRNNTTGVIKDLTEAEVEKIVMEFPCLRHASNSTYFRNRITSVSPLP